MNWSRLDTTASTFLATLWPTWRTAPICAALREDGVLVVDLDQLRLLVHDQHRLGEDRATLRRERRTMPARCCTCCWIFSGE
jgi:hypothetical protein